MTPERHALDKEPTMKELCLASGNPDKLKEFRAALEPAPEPGEPIRTQNAVSRTHVLVPSEPRDRKRHLEDPMGAL